MKFNEYFSLPLLLIGMVIIAGCQMFAPPEDDEGLTSEYLMECELVAHSLTFGSLKRCVNDESICYVTNDGISCELK